MKLHEERLVAVPTSVAFAYASDFSNTAQWDPGVASSRQLGDGPVGVGTEFELAVRFGGSTSPSIFEITKYEPDRLVVLEGKAESWSALDEIRFEPVQDSTRIVYTSRITFRNFLRYLSPLLSPVFNRIGRKALDGLTAQLQR